MKKTILTVALLSLSITAFAEGNVSLFSITPSILQATLRSDSKTSVQYTLTNNSANTLRGITLPIWPAGISTQSIFNTCSSVLAAHTTCHFNILIQGRNQPSILSLRPTICINNGGFCGRPDANQILTITTLPITDHAYAYLPILNNNQSYSNNMVSANTTTPYRLNTPYTNDFDFTSNGPNAGGIAVSKDGHYAYVVDRGNEAVKILSLTQGQMTLVGTLSFSNTDNLQSIVVNPAGTRAYVSAGTTVYAINVNDKSSPLLLEHNDTMTIDSQTFSMAISPDGSKLYIPCPYGGSYGTIDLFNLNNDLNTPFHPPLSYTTAAATPFAAVVSPDGTAVYITNNAKNNAGVSKISDANDPVNLSFNQRLLPLPNDSYPEGLTISNDETTLYVVEDYANSQAAIINLNTLNSETVDLGNASYSVGAALSPDGSKLFVTNNSSPPLTVIDLENGNQVYQAFDNRTDFGKSTARSNFIN